ncbi:MAG: Undecaprenyl-phosphate 4-deoxy-4-formamido-L-arabinose transferase [Microgenomates group bacterium ADurb.Bin219]|nr:MAG: Undecaprenyl-phosphate 4-deoxy-4-formamido-L-arabinose transferase [Microgenomates group bacterium ADurb.Bin219]
MNNKKPYLSIIIPCYNEKENLQRGVLDEVLDYLSKQNFAWEVIISDDGSNDGSTEIIKESIKEQEGFSLIANKHGGKPFAIWQGIKKAKGEFVLFTDMDQSTPIKELAKLIPFFDKYEIVIGSRGLERENFSLIRKVGSSVFRNFRKIILLRDIDDTQCGFKVFRKDIAEKLFPRLQFFKESEKVKGWKVTSFDVELLFLAEKSGYKIKEVPVEWFDRDVSKGKERSYSKESVEMLEQIIRVKINDIKGRYNQ